MPGDSVTKPIKPQAFWTSLKLLLDDSETKSQIQALSDAGALGRSSTDFIVTVLKNFWQAVAETNPDARSEPRTTVLWGSIGVNACHQALARVISTILGAEVPDVTKENFQEMIGESQVADYEFWFSRSGAKREDYPGAKGDATTFTRGSGYSRLAKELETDWRAILHHGGPTKRVLV